ncbi:unnamed protein product [Citrullus colocynthis]|uniref:Uncharacterized protein n=1 Tax=Citrullus colocynthis TaxID=252529 RepID=A0ABP0YWM1_9ROSI
MNEEEDVDTPTHMSISSSLQYVGLVHKSDDSEESAFGGSASECLSPTSSYIYASDADDVESTMLPNKAFADYYTALHNDGIDIIKEYSEYLILRLTQIQTTLLLWSHQYNHLVRALAKFVI